MDAQTRTLREKLIEVAKRKRTILYSEVAPVVKLQAHDFTLFRILDDINRHEHEAGRPLLTAVVVRKEDGMPGGGFFKVARNWDSIAPAMTGRCIGCGSWSRSTRSGPAPDLLPLKGIR